MKWWILLLLPVLTWAQDFPFEQEIDTIPVEIDGWQPFQPWNFGMYWSSPGFGDLDADGDLDLFCGGYYVKILFACNDGTATDFIFKVASEEFLGIDV